MCLENYLLGSLSLYLALLYETVVDSDWFTVVKIVGAIVLSFDVSVVDVLNLLSYSRMYK